MVIYGFQDEPIKKGDLICFSLIHFQVALDEAAILLDLASVEGTWDDLVVVERIAECYKEAGLHAIARFVLYQG